MADEHADRLAEAVSAGDQHLAGLLGQERTLAFRQRLAALHPDFDRYVTGFVFGVARDRPNLDRKTQALCVLAVLTATGAAPQLAANIRYALAAGATEADIEEVFLLMAPFAGFPAAWNAFVALRGVLDGEPTP